MRKLVLACALILPSIANAGPLFDVVTGAALIVNGGAFQVLSSNAKDDKEDAEERALTHLGLAAEFNATAWFNYGLGNTATGLFYEALSIGELNQYYNEAEETLDKQEEEGLYKGVSYVSFAIGGVFLAKGLYGYMTATPVSGLKSQEKGRNWAENLKIGPTPRGNGLQVAYSLKF